MEFIRSSSSLVRPHSRFSQAHFSFGSIGWWMFVALWLVSFLDVSGDYVIFYNTPYWNGEILVPELRVQIQFISTVLIGLLALLGLRALLRGRVGYKIAPEIKLFLLFLVLSTAWGILVGLIKGVPLIYIIGDSRNLVTYLIMFGIGGFVTRQGPGGLHRLFLIGCGILILKLFCGFGMSLASGAGLMWRSLLKQTDFFAPLLFVALGAVLYGKRPAQRGRYFILALLASFGIYAAQLRGLFVGTLAGVLFFSINSLGSRHFHRLFVIGLVILALGLGAGIVLQGNVTKSFGYWGGSETYAPGLEYRERQADRLLTIFGNNWLVGAGLGFFDPTYEGYQDWMPRPYLVELEYLNLLAKLGLVGFTLWLAAFFFLFLGCIRAVHRTIEPEDRGFMLGLTAGLVAMMGASIFQTGYSSVYFHLYIVLTILVLSTHRVSQLQVHPIQDSKDNYYSSTKYVTLFRAQHTAPAVHESNSERREAGAE